MSRGLQRRNRKDGKPITLRTNRKIVKPVTLYYWELFRKDQTCLSTSCTQSVIEGLMAKLLGIHSLHDLSHHSSFSSNSLEVRFS
jgi:hypothetical protein